MAPGVSPSRFARRSANCCALANAGTPSALFSCLLTTSVKAVEKSSRSFILVLSANGTSWPNTLAEPPMSWSHCARRCMAALTANGVSRPKLLISGALAPVRLAETPVKGLPVIATCTAPGLKLPSAAIVMGRLALTVAAAPFRVTSVSSVVPCSSPRVRIPAASPSGLASWTCRSASRLTVPLATLAPRKPTLSAKFRLLAWMSPASRKSSIFRKKASSTDRPGVRSTPKEKSRRMLAVRSRAPPSAVIARPLGDCGTARLTPLSVRLASSTRSNRIWLPYWSPLTADRPGIPARAPTRPSVVLVPPPAR